MENKIVRWLIGASGFVLISGVFGCFIWWFALLQEEEYRQERAEEDARIASIEAFQHRVADALKERYGGVAANVSELPEETNSFRANVYIRFRDSGYTACVVTVDDSPRNTKVVC